MTGEALYWYASIFAWLFFTGIGLPPCPEEAGILYAAGVNALHPEVRWPLAWLATAVGIMAADSVLYGIGRRWGPKLFEYRWVQKLMSTKRRERIESKFHKHGIKLLVVARFLPPLRTGVFMIAGASKYSFLKFLLADAVYGVVGVGAFFFCGSFLVDVIHRFERPAIYAGAGALTVFILWRYYKFLARCEGRGCGPQPPASVLEPVSGVVPDGQPAKNPAAAPAARAEVKVEFGKA